MTKKNSKKKKTPRRVVDVTKHRSFAVAKFSGYKKADYEHEIRDLEAALEVVVEERNTLFATKAQEFIWTDNDGRTWRVSQMADQHLHNTIFFVARKFVSSFGHARFISGLVHYADAFVQLTREAKRRGLDV